MDHRAAVVGVDDGGGGDEEEEEEAEKAEDGRCCSCCYWGQHVCVELASACLLDGVVVIFFVREVWNGGISFQVSLSVWLAEFFFPDERER